MRTKTFASLFSCFPHSYTSPGCDQNDWIVGTHYRHELPSRNGRAPALRTRTPGAETVPDDATRGRTCRKNLRLVFLCSRTTKREVDRDRRSPEQHADLLRKRRHSTSIRAIGSPGFGVAAKSSPRDFSPPELFADGFVCARTSPLESLLKIAHSNLKRRLFFRRTWTQVPRKQLHRVHRAP